MAEENKSTEEQKAKRIKEKIAQIEKEENVKIKPGIHFLQYNPNYYPVDLKLALAVLEKHEVKFSVDVEFLPK